MSIREDIIERIKNGDLSEIELKQLNKIIGKEESKEKLREMEYGHLKDTLQTREIPFKDTSDFGEASGNLDNPSHLNLNTRLSADDIGACVRFDELKKITPLPGSITTIFKELKVSEGGKGRSEKVQIATGIKESKPMIQSFKDFFKPHPKKEEESGKSTEIIGR